MNYYLVHRGEAELRITCDTTKIALQASRQERERELRSPKNGKTLEETTTQKLQNVVWNDVLLALNTSRNIIFECLNENSKTFFVEKIFKIHNFT